MKRFISRRDIVFAVLIVLAAAAAMIFCRRTAPEGVLITLHGQEYSFVPFSGIKPGEETELNVGGVKVRIGRGDSYIAESDCPGGPSRCGECCGGAAARRAVSASRRKARAFERYHNACRRKAGACRCACRFCGKIAVCSAHKGVHRLSDEPCGRADIHADMRHNASEKHRVGLCRHRHYRRGAPQLRAVGCMLRLGGKRDTLLSSVPCRRVRCHRRAERSTACRSGEIHTTRNNRKG